jgi:4-amino-4-deoxy-L-arabinose transferase-like glycosyltransferase
VTSSAEWRGVVESLVNHFPWVLAAYFAVQTVRRLVEPHALGLDEAEQILMTQAFAWGYGSQPPLYTWIQKLVFSVIGQSVLGLAILKNVVLFLTYLFVFLAAGPVLGDRSKAAVVSLSLFFIPQIAWESQRALVHTPMVACAAAGTFLCSIHLMTQRRLVDYVLFGGAVAAGYLSKYSYPLFLLGLLGAALFFPQGRRAIFDWRMFLVSLPIAVLATLPTTVWSLANFDLVLSRAGKFGIESEGSALITWIAGITELMAATVAFSILCVGLYLITAFVPFHRVVEASVFDEMAKAAELSTGAALRRLTLLMPLLCLGLLVVFVVVTRATDFKDRWLQPYLFVLPLTCFVALDHRLDRLRQLMLAGIASFLALFVIAALLVYNRLPELGEHPSNTTAPFAEVVEEIRRQGFVAGTIVSEESFVSGNIAFRLPRTRAATAEYSRLPIRYPTPILLAWEGNDSRPDEETTAAYQAVCSAPLPTQLNARTIRAPFTGSRRHVFELTVALIENCAT